MSIELKWLPYQDPDDHLELWLSDPPGWFRYRGELVRVEPADLDKHPSQWGTLEGLPFQVSWPHPVGPIYVRRVP